MIDIAKNRLLTRKHVAKQAAQLREYLLPVFKCRNSHEIAFEKGMTVSQPRRSIAVENVALRLTCRVRAVRLSSTCLARDRDAAGQAVEGGGGARLAALSARGVSRAGIGQALPARVPVKCIR